MRKIAFLLFTFIAVMAASAQNKGAEAKFDKTAVDFGTFSEAEPVKTATFTITNVGDSPLVINQAVASCGCTVPEHTKTPILPGKTGTIKVTYDGTGKLPGTFRKSIVVRMNTKVELVRLYIEGNMTAK
jgi:hypothetical protein